MGTKESFTLQYDILSREDKITCCLELLRNVPQKKVLVDGLAGAGKGTLAEKIVRDLELEGVSAGDVYRVITWYFLQCQVTAENISELKDDVVKEILLELGTEFFTGGPEWWVMNPNTGKRQNIFSELHSKAVNDNISEIAGTDAVRDVVDDYQREIAADNNNVFLEGRNMWQVFRDVEGVVLIYLYASEAELIRREIERQKKLGNEIDEEEAVERVIERNKKDNDRERGKLLMPNEAHEGGYQLILDTTDLEPNDGYLAVLEGLCGELVG